ncbi:hypothetical protein THASP1DRAFT_29664 [Thamnocephalis sphaerospora]|uniref:Uncharacterized protein n=1 Tax=Thamnocephalis sphaerospora TaxID=78915 RepID=A0A4P9XSZ8_9FUNG|nr:hypothetical protein THASP1DRAFT_29664 [Thamnocephalis sphaerospora]|eukprot:RKP08530.1 hypothetical protein THASP1DRAFT_29664 [Thamnocephalis sphaerospora]
MPTPTETPSTADSWLPTVRASCQRVLDACPADRLDLAAMDAWLAELDTTTTDASPATALQPPPLPLRFETLDDELTVRCLLELLEGELDNSEALVQAASNRSARDTILFGVLSLHISNEQLNAHRLATIPLADVASCFSLPLQREVPHPTLPFVTMGERTPTWECAEHVRKLLTTLGTEAEQAGQATVGALVRQAAERARACQGTAAVFVDELVRLLPSFDDQSILHGQPVFTRSAAQRLAQHLQQHFGNEHNGLFAFAEPKEPGDVGTACHLHRLARSLMARHWLLPAADTIYTTVAGGTTPENDTAAETAATEDASAVETPSSQPDVTIEERAVALALVERAAQRLAHFPWATPARLEGLLLLLLR